MFTAVTEPNPDPPRSINPITGDSLMLADVAFRFANAFGITEAVTSS